MKSISKEIIFSKIFFGVWFARKITKFENANAAGIRQACLAEPGQNCRIPAGHLRARLDPAGSGHFCRISAGSVAGSGQIRPDSGHFGQIRPDQ
jgi:hypothetical protein